MRNILSSGVLGELHSVRVNWAEYKRRWDWQTLKKNGGGLMNNIGSHVLSIILPLMGSRVTEVFADLRNIKDPGDSEDHIQAMLKTESGIVADLLVSTAVPLSGPRWTLCGSLGSMVSDETTTRIRFLDTGDRPSREVVDGSAPGREYCSESLPWKEKEIPIDPNPVKCFHENVYEVLAHGAAPGVTPESAAEVVRVTKLVQAFAS
jgi:predicted dehydrogenase